MIHEAALEGSEDDERVGIVALQTSGEIFASCRVLRQIGFKLLCAAGTDLLLTKLPKRRSRKRAPYSLKTNGISKGPLSVERCGVTVGKQDT
jgi:hypothetical protein